MFFCCSTMKLHLDFVEITLSIQIADTATTLWLLCTVSSLLPLKLFLTSFQYTFCFFLLFLSTHFDCFLFQGKDIFINGNAGSVIIINSKTTVDISDTSNRIATCSENDPCTGSIGTGSTCSSASSSIDGVVCSLPACPAIVEGSNWNVWSASCSMSTTHSVEQGETVKIKKSASMSGELVIDRGATSGNNRHFYVKGTLEMEDVTLTGGYYSVSSFVLCILCDIRTYTIV